MVEGVDKKCKRPGCNKMYNPSNNDGTSCKFHSGQPIFHDLKKGWSCCNQIAYEWDEFEKIKGCCMGKHSDDLSLAQEGSEQGFWRSTTVETASNALEKERIKSLKTAADFNAQQEIKKEEKKQAEAAAGLLSDKKPVMTKDGNRFVCANKGCIAKNFIDEENKETAC